MCVQTLWDFEFVMATTAAAIQFQAVFAHPRLNLHKNTVTFITGLIEAPRVPSGLNFHLRLFQSIK